MRSCCPIPFKSVFGNWEKNIKNKGKYLYHIKYKGKYLYPIYFKCSGYSPMYFSLDFLRERKRFLVEEIYNNVEFRHKAVRFCYA